MVADLGGEGLVASYVEVGSASDFVGGYAFASFDVTKNSNFCHGSLSSVGKGKGLEGEFGVWTLVEMRKVSGTRRFRFRSLSPSVPTLIPSF